MQQIVPLGEDDFLVAHLRPAAPLVAEYTRIRGGREETLASSPPLAFAQTGPTIIANDGHWWISREGDEGARSGVFFAWTEGDRVEQKQVPLIRRYGQVWLPVPGNEPRGLEISVAREQPSLRIDELTPAGARPLAAFPWWQTAELIRNVGSTQWSVEALGDGRLAIVAADGPPEEMTLRLRLVGGGPPTESILPCSHTIDHPLATAIDPSGRIAVVGLTRARTVVAVLADVGSPEDARCRVISSMEIAALPPFGSPEVIWAGDRFIAAWFSKEGAIRACELGDLRSAPIVVEVGTNADVEHPLERLVYADEESVIFLWKERSGELIHRRLPRELNGWALVAVLRQTLCRTLETRSVPW